MRRRDRRRARGGRAHPGGGVPDAHPGVADGDRTRGGDAAPGALTRCGRRLAPASPAALPALPEAFTSGLPWAHRDARPKATREAPTMTNEAHVTPALEAAARRRRELREALVAFEDALASPIRDRETWRARGRRRPRVAGPTPSRTTSRATEAPERPVRRDARTSPPPVVAKAAACATSIRRSPPRSSRRGRLGGLARSTRPTSSGPRRAPAPDGPDRAPPPARRRPRLGGVRDRHRRHRRRLEPTRWSTARMLPGPAPRRGQVAVIDGGLATELEALGHRLCRRLWSARLLADEPEAIAAPTWPTTGPARASRSRPATRPRSRGSPPGDRARRRPRCSCGGASSSPARRARGTGPSAPRGPGPAARGGLDRTVRRLPRRRLRVPRALRRGPGGAARLPP